VRLAIDDDDDDDDGCGEHDGCGGGGPFLSELPPLNFCFLKENEKLLSINLSGNLLGERAGAPLQKAIGKYSI